MATTLTCQSVDSPCFGAHIIEPPITLRLKFNFLDTTTITTHARTRFDAFLPSCLPMNERSYDMCTENLGNETGCEITEFALLPYIKDDESALKEIVETKKFVSRSFPPPLTTMSGAESILVSPCREAGRLIIKATRSPSLMYWMERSDGRLRMCVLGSCNEEEAVVDELEVDEDESVTQEEAEAESEDGGKDYELGNDVVRMKVGGGGRCKQGQPQNAARLFNWETFNWVATT